MKYSLEILALEKVRRRAVKKATCHWLPAYTSICTYMCAHMGAHTHGHTCYACKLMMTLVLANVCFLLVCKRRWYLWFCLLDLSQKYLIYKTVIKKCILIFTVEDHGTITIRKTTLPITLRKADSWPSHWIKTRVRKQPLLWNL